MSGKSKQTVVLDEALYKRLQQASVDRDMTYQELLAEGARLVLGAPATPRSIDAKIPASYRPYMDRLAGILASGDKTKIRAVIALIDVLG